MGLTLNTPQSRCRTLLLSSLVVNILTLQPRLQVSTTVLSLQITFPCYRISYKRTYKLCVLLCQPLFSWHNIFKLCILLCLSIVILFLFVSSVSLHNHRLFIHHLYNNLFIHSLIDGYLACFYFRVNMNKVVNPFNCCFPVLDETCANIYHFICV